MSTITAAIDLGTNSFRLLIASCAPQTKPKVITKITKTVRLGENLKTNGLLQKTAINRGITALKDFAEILAEFKPQKIRVCGTAAVRQAGNSPFFCTLASQQLGTSINIISAEEEAQLAFNGSMAGLAAPNKPVIMVDSGGGSSEIIYRATSDHHNQTNNNSFFTSIALGAVNLTEKFFTQKDTVSDVGPIKKFLSATYQDKLADLLTIVAKNDYILVASGGTATSLAALDLNLKTYDENVIQGHRVSRNKLDAIINKLRNTPTNQRYLLTALDHRRSEIILAGAMIYHALLVFLKSEHFIVSDWGLLEGILLSANSQ